MLDEVTVGSGKVVPSSQVQVIQNLEGGILTELVVHEGEVVKKDQVLVRLSDTKSTVNYKEGRKRYLSLLAANARLHAESNGHDKVNFPPELYAASRNPEIVANAAYWIVTQNSRELTGQFLIDEEILTKAGETDFARYSMMPGVTPMRDLFLE